MKLYGHVWSVNTRKVLATLAEKGHEATFAPVMLPKGEHKQPEYLRLQPFGKVPVLEDDGFVLYEARAINAYLEATLDGPSLLPKSARGRARVDQWINVADAYLVPHVRPIVVELLFRPYLGGERDDAAVAAGRAHLGEALEVVDRALAEAPFLAGDAFTLADIHWLPYVDYLIAIGEGAPVEERRNLRAWWQRASARPAWQRVAHTGPQPYDPAVRQEAVQRANA